MRNISFALTTEQFMNRSKTVTRRVGWKNLKAGTHLMGCKKYQGIKPGEKLERLGEIRVTKVSRETLGKMAADPGYGLKESRREGFPQMNGRGFVAMFCEHMKTKPSDTVTRIEFEYVEHLRSAAPVGRWLRRNS